MKKIIILCTFALMILCGCGKVDYREKVVTEDNYETIFQEENDLTEEEQAYLQKIVFRNILMPSALYNKTIGELIEEGKLIEEQKKAEENRPYKKLNDISNNFVTKIWNDLFCDVTHYIGDGKNSVGEEFDLEYAIHRADELMKERDTYNEYILSLNGDEYEEIKYIWNKLIAEIDNMYEKIKTEPPKASDDTYNFNVDKFMKYSEDFDDEIRKLK